MHLLYYLFVAICGVATMFAVGAAIALWYDRTKLNQRFVLSIILIVAFLGIMAMAYLGDIARGMLL